MEQLDSVLISVRLTSRISFFFFFFFFFFFHLTKLNFHCLILFAV